MVVENRHVTVARIAPYQVQKAIDADVRAFDHLMEATLVEMQIPGQTARCIAFALLDQLDESHIVGRERIDAGVLDDPIGSQKDGRVD